MSREFKKTVLLGVSGGISAYKAAYVASGLKKKDCDVHVLMTKNATEFVTPLTFETLSGNRCCVDTFDRNYEFSTEHISLAKKADLVLVAPATANVIAKLAHGIADDMLTTTVLACTCKKLIAPAMNTAMLENAATEENLRILRERGWTIIEPVSGQLACGDTGRGKLPEPQELIAAVESELFGRQDLEGLQVLVTAGPTREAIDPVRFITNHSTGKMGYALAQAAARRGARVTLVSGPVDLVPPADVEVVPVVSAADMFREVTGRAAAQDVIIKAAAVADYRPAKEATEKIKKSDGAASIELERTDDILKYLGEHAGGDTFLCGFSMETENELENSRAKLVSKNVQMIVSNSLRKEGAGFGSDTNAVTIITQEEEIALPVLPKLEVADRILDEIAKRLPGDRKARAAKEGAEERE